MSVLVVVLRARIRDLIGDVNSEEPVINPGRLDAIINKQARSIAAQTIRPQETVQSIALVATTYDYALASSGIVDHVAQVFLNAGGTELEYLPFEFFNSRYRQATSAPQASGTPIEYTTWETAAQVMTLRVGPTPASAADGPLKVYHSILPAMSSDAAYGDLPTTIPFSTELVAGLEAACAAEAVAGMSKELAAKIGLDRAAVVGRWEADAAAAIRQYNLRQSRNGRRQDRIMRGQSHRWSNWTVRA